MKVKVEVDVLRLEVIKGGVAINPDEKQTDNDASAHLETSQFARNRPAKQNKFN